MANSVIGALRVNLGLDSAQFDRGARQAQSTAQRLGRQMQGIGAAISAIGVGITLAIRGQVNAADDLAKAADRIGVPVEALSQLQHAANLSGVSMQGLQTALQRLSRGMVDDAARFAELGIAVRDGAGNMRPTVDVLQDVADRLAAMPEGAARTALAIELLGRSGADLIPMLQGGSAGIRRMMEDADRLGMTLSEGTARAAERFNDNLTRLRGVITGISRQIMAALVPVLESVSEWLVEVSSRFARLTPEMQTFAAIAAGVVMAIGPVVLALGTLARALMAVRIAAMAAAGPWGVLAGAVALAAGYFLAFRRQAEPVEGTLEAVAAAQAALNAALGVFHETAAPSAGREAHSYAQNLERQAAAALAAAEAELALMQAEIARFQSAPMEERGLLGDMEDGAMRRNFELAQSQIAGLRTTLDNARQTVIELRRGLSDDAGPTFLGTVAVEAERAGGAVRRVAEEVPVLTEEMKRAVEVADRLRGAFESAFVNAVTRTRSLRDAVAGLAQDLARMAAQAAFRTIFGNLNFGGGFLGRIFGGVRSFEGGGFTGAGARSGGMDGRGGMLAMIHPNETIIDHTRGGDANQPVQVVIRVLPSGEFDARVQQTARAVVRVETPGMIGGAMASAREQRFF